jgi:hypothetical protein
MWERVTHAASAPRCPCANTPQEFEPSIKPQDTSEHDFTRGGILQEHKLELQLWASLRGQLLARTVRPPLCFPALQPSAPPSHTAAAPLPSRLPAPALAELCHHISVAHSASRNFYHSPAPLHAP